MYQPYHLMYTKTHVYAFIWNNITLQAVMKEQLGGDHMSIAWGTGANPSPVLIPASASKMPDHKWGSATPTQSPSKQPTGSPVTQSPSSSPVTSSPTTTLDPTLSPSKSPVTSSPTTSDPTLSPSKSPVTTSPTKSPSLSPVTSSPTSSCTLAKVGESCKDGVDCCSGACSGGQLSSRVCLAGDGNSVPEPAPGPEPDSSPSPPSPTTQPVSCGLPKNGQCGNNDSLCCSGNCKNNGRCS